MPTRAAEGEHNVLASRIEALETLVAQQKAQIDTRARLIDAHHLEIGVPT